MKNMNYVHIARVVTLCPCIIIAFFAEFEEEENVDDLEETTTDATSLSSQGLSLSDWSAGHSSVYEDLDYLGEAAGMPRPEDLIFLEEEGSGGTISPTDGVLLQRRSVQQSNTRRLALPSTGCWRTDGTIGTVGTVKNGPVGQIWV